MNIIALLIIIITARVYVCVFTVNNQKTRTTMTVEKSL